MKKINEGFMCIACGRDVPGAMRTCRNHCPFCFTSLHVDDKIPGDRASLCMGVMLPTEYVISNSQTKIHFVCQKCGADHRNKASVDDDVGVLDRIIKKTFSV